MEAERGKSPRIGAKTKTIEKKKKKKKTFRVSREERKNIFTVVIAINNFSFSSSFIKYFTRLSSHIAMCETYHRSIFISLFILEALWKFEIFFHFAMIKNIPSILALPGIGEKKNKREDNLIAHKKEVKR